MAELEARLRRLEDRAALDDLIVRYFLAADGDDLHGVGDSFIEDATFGSSGQVQAIGRAAIVDFIAGARSEMGLTLHSSHHALFSFRDDDEASGIVAARLELALGGQSLFGAVRYQDEYVRAAGRWSIASRDMRVVYIAPWADVGAAFASPTPVRWPGTDPTPSDFPRKVTRK